jgi:hypothetical protein
MPLPVAKERFRQGMDELDEKLLKNMKRYCLITTQSIVNFWIY